MNQIDCIQCGGIKNASQMQYKLCNHCMKENKKKKVLKNNTTALFCSGCNNVVTTPGLCKKCLDREVKATLRNIKYLIRTYYNLMEK